MDTLKLGQLLREKNILVRETSTNFICICPYCGDHPNPAKKGHLYVSKKIERPFYHCFLNEETGIIPKLIKDITGTPGTIQEIFGDTKLDFSKITNTSVTKVVKNKAYLVPEMKSSLFVNKTSYIKKRTNGKKQPEEIPRLIFDFEQFFYINKIDIESIGIQKKLLNYFQNSFVGFLGSLNSLLFFRNIDDRSGFKFYKAELQKDSLDLIDYWEIPGNNPDSNKVVFAEGNFNILGESSYDTLGVKNSVRSYVSCNSSSYPSVIKSYCFSNSIYQCQPIILSDTDKSSSWYFFKLQENLPLVENVQLFYNSSGKDFGTFPIRPYNKEFILKPWNKTQKR